MNKNLHISGIVILLMVATSFVIPHPRKSFPYRQFGLSDREAAYHLLNRFTFGPTPGQEDLVIHMGLEKWFDLQLQANYPDDSLNALLIDYESLKMNNRDIAATFRRPGQLLKMAVKQGDIVMDSTGASPKEYKDQLRNLMTEKGYKPQAELIRQLISQKILRAAYSENQLKEVLADFWFNHFNVSWTKGESRNFITVYERDAIRANVSGHFKDLLTATAKSPAMLTYLDNFKSVASDSSARSKKPRGLNENYARELMELHTLGVDGGYTQTDVTNAARILTGWTIYPLKSDAVQGITTGSETANNEVKREIKAVRDGDFLFTTIRHDNEQKTVLNHLFPANGGYEEGLKLLDLLASHPATAGFIAKKLAIHFVSDNPPQSLIDKMAARFLKTNGDIKEVLLTMVRSPEFWDPKTIGKKIKSPFELAISSVRRLNAGIRSPIRLNTWITKMGQQIYYCLAPTGFPDQEKYWINTGSLINRMNFEAAMMSKKVPGIWVNNGEVGNEIISPAFQRK